MFISDVRLSGLELGVSGPSVDEVTRVDTTPPADVTADVATNGVRDDDDDE